jgi:hypothetical protein
MAEKRLSEIDEATTTQNTDLVEIAQDDGFGAYVSKKIEFGNFIPTSAKSGAFGITIDAGTSIITTGLKNWVTIPYDCTIASWQLLADISGSIVIDLWKDTLANYPPDASDSITASAKPTLSSQTSNSSSTLTGWTTSVSAGDVVAFNVDSVTDIHKITLTIGVLKA